MAEVRRGAPSLGEIRHGHVVRATDAEIQATRLPSSFSADWDQAAGVTARFGELSLAGLSAINAAFSPISTGDTGLQRTLADAPLLGEDSRPNREIVDILMTKDITGSARLLGAYEHGTALLRFARTASLLDEVVELPPTDQQIATSTLAIPPYYRVDQDERAVDGWKSIGETMNMGPVKRLSVRTSETPATVWSAADVQTDGSPERELVVIKIGGDYRDSRVMVTKTSFSEGFNTDYPKGGFADVRRHADGLEYAITQKLATDAA